MRKLRNSLFQKTYQEIYQQFQEDCARESIAKKKSLFFVFALNSYGQMIEGVKITMAGITTEDELGAHEKESLGVLMTASYEACKQVQSIVFAGKTDECFSLSFGSTTSGFYLGRKDELVDKEILVGMIYQNVENPAKYKFILDRFYFRIVEEFAVAGPVSIGPQNTVDNTFEDASPLFENIEDGEIDALFNPYFEV